MSTRNIYIVEDDDAVRISLQSVFSTMPNTLVWGFKSGDAFLERADENGPGCVVLDYHMPGSNGLETLRKLNEREVRHQVIMLTGNGEVPTAVEAMKAGAFDFLEKPCAFETLIATVERALAHLEASNEAAARVDMAVAKLRLLTARELDVLKRLIVGDSNKAIAQNLDISPRTVEIHRARMTEKLGARSISDAMRIAFAAGLLPPD